MYFDTEKWKSWYESFNKSWHQIQEKSLLSRGGAILKSKPIFASAQIFQNFVVFAEFCKNVPCKLNIIEYNPIDGGEFKQTTPERLNNFVKVLEDHGVIVNVRRSRGKDIDAACGQLANKNKLAVIEYK